MKQKDISTNKNFNVSKKTISKKNSKKKVSTKIFQKKFQKPVQRVIPIPKEDETNGQNRPKLSFFGIMRLLTYIKEMVPNCFRFISRIFS